MLHQNNRFTTTRKVFVLNPFAPIAAGYKIPGPGSHSPEKVYVNKPCAPKFSMGIKHSDFLTPLIVEVQD